MPSSLFYAVISACPFKSTQIYSPLLFCFFVHKISHERKSQNWRAFNYCRQFLLFLACNSNYPSGKGALARLIYFSLYLADWPKYLLTESNSTCTFSLLNANLCLVRSCQQIFAFYPSLPVFFQLFAPKQLTTKKLKKKTKKNHSLL